MALILGYKVNLLKIDETDDIYSVVEQKTRGDILEELIIQCNQCKSLIRLSGFLLLEN